MEFPETETVEEESSSSSSDEMDICTTPPPTVSDVVSVPEPPKWNVDDLVTPPPPIISVRILSISFSLTKKSISFTY